MNDNVENTITKDLVSKHHDEDYAYLRKAGLEYIEELGSKLWTDYNEHDPGITILEALCYAITELGYRCNLPMQDLLTDQDGQIVKGQVLFTPKEILTQAPLNVNDYRKLLIDIAGVHNAWIFYGDYDKDNNVLSPIAQEVPFYADCKNDQLVIKPSTAHPVNLRGLYRVLLDLDVNSQLGDLNNGHLQVENPKSGTYSAGAASLTLVFPSWKAVSTEALFSLDVNKEITLGIIEVSEKGSSWEVKINFSSNANYDISASVSVDLQPSGRQLVTKDIKDFFADTGFAKMVISLYLLKIQKAKKIIDTARKTLMENRNLCEDFLSIDTVEDEEIAICCDIDIATHADMEEIQAKVFLAIEEYLNPTVKFYLLNQMMDKYPLDEIYEGPRLGHGFIDTKELEKTQLRELIHSSDIINALMNIEGVLAVRDFRMTKYDKEGKVIKGQSGKEWCLSIAKWHKPIFSETKSKIIFYKNKFPYLPSIKEVRDILKLLKSLNAANKLNGHEEDLHIPKGAHFPLDNYTSIQTLFPSTYGIGNAALPSNVPAVRKAQANQLRGYLLFYDQLLADFFMQLQDARELFSVNDLTHTYSAQFLDDIKGIDPVYKKNGSAPLLESLINDPLKSANSSLPPSEWQQLYESKETYIERRNRFLDHLMARFAESFNEYVFLMYSLDYSTQQETNIDPETIIGNKINFLKEYPEISYSRGLAYNYFPQKADFTIDKTKLWNTDNVSGLEKKLCMLGGFSNPVLPKNVQSHYRRFLYCLGKITKTKGIIDVTKFRFVFTTGVNTLTSEKEYKNQVEINDDLPGFISMAMIETNYCTKKTGAVWNVHIVDGDCKSLAKSNDFSSLDDAKKAIKLFVAEFLSECENEGLHLIEHILLRPRKKLTANGKDFELAPVCLDPDCDFCGEQDPYSFKLSIVIPYWPSHLRSMAFRNYFENIARTETPAHIMIKVCWIDNSEMYEFDNLYKTWITALAGYAERPGYVLAVRKMRDANDALLEKLFKLHSEYPPASFHDCDESKNNPVMLGRTTIE